MNTNLSNYTNTLLLLMTDCIDSLILDKGLILFDES